MTDTELIDWVERGGYQVFVMKGSGTFWAVATTGAFGLCIIITDSHPTWRTAVEAAIKRDRRDDS